MTVDEDDEALNWAGGSDPSHVETAVAPKVAKPTPAAKGAPTEQPDAGEALPPVASAAVLVSLGILGGVYLLYTVGWIISLQKFYYLSTSPLDQIAFQVQQYLAIIAPVVWFGSVFYLTRHRKPVVRLIWLVIGAVVLVPWSFVFGS